MRGLNKSFGYERLLTRLRRKVSLEKEKKLRFIISKVVIKARERTTKTKTPRH
jgi:hypothetical protein